MVRTKNSGDANIAKAKADLESARVVANLEKGQFERGLVDGAPTKLTVPFDVAKAIFIDGNQALVTVIVDNLCISGKCLSNSDANKALPSSQSDFARAWQKTNAKGNNDPVVPCARIGGQWYIAAQ